MVLTILERVLPLAMVAAGMSVAIYLFVTLKREIQDKWSKMQNEQLAVLESLRALESRLLEVEREISTMPEQYVPPGPAPTSGMNLNKRTQALRLVRQGQGPEHIAAALSLPRKEVELLLKVNHIVNERLGQLTS